MHLKVTKTLEIAGSRLMVEIIDPAGNKSADNKPALIFLHEALGSIGQWKSYPLDLCVRTGCRGIVYDRKGHGKSDPLDSPRTIHFYREEAEIVLPALLDALDVQRPALIGHSDGATIALKYASTFKERVSGVISEAAHVFIEEITLDGIRHARELYETSDLREKLARYHGDKTDAIFNAWADTWLQPEVREWNMIADLRSIRCPLLLVQGEDDAYGSAAQVNTIAENVSSPVEIMMLANTGHVPHLQARKAVLDRMAEFIEALNFGVN